MSAGLAECGLGCPRARRPSWQGWGGQEQLLFHIICLEDQVRGPVGQMRKPRSEMLNPSARALAYLLCEDAAGGRSWIGICSPDAASPLLSPHAPLLLFMSLVSPSISQVSV